MSSLSLSGTSCRSRCRHEAPRLGGADRDRRAGRCCCKFGAEANGECPVVVLDVADSSAAKRTFLWDGSSLREAASWTCKEEGRFPEDAAAVDVVGQSVGTHMAAAKRLSCGNGDCCGSAVCCCCELWQSCVGIMSERKMGNETKAQATKGATPMKFGFLELGCFMWSIILRRRA